MTTEELVTALEAKRPEMMRIAQALLRSSGLVDEAEDFIQDALIKILRNAEGYTFDEGNVGGLFQTTLVHLIYDRNAVKKTAERGSDEYTRIYQPDSQAQIKQRERLKIDVALAMDRLPDPLTRQIVRLAWMNDQPHRRIKRTLKVSGETVAQALAVAKPILRLELARYDHRQRPANIPLTEDRPGVSTSQPLYKEGTDETDSTIPLGGSGPEMNLLETLFEQAA